MWKYIPEYNAGYIFFAYNKEEQRSYMSLKQKYKSYFTDKSFQHSTESGIVLLILSLILNWHASLYAAMMASNPVTDIVLNNVRVYDLTDIFVYGPIFFFAFVLFLAIKEPNKIPFTLKAMALFIIVRSVFVSLTHIGPFATQMSIGEGMIRNFTSGDDLFFSGHTGLPFLMALVFWRVLYLRIIFIFTSILFGVVVLLGHVHYTIDVFSAFFITYTIYHVAEVFFKKERKFFYQTEGPGTEPLL